MTDAKAQKCGTCGYTLNVNCPACRDAEPIIDGSPLWSGLPPAPLSGLVHRGPVPETSFTPKSVQKRIAAQKGEPYPFPEAPKAVGDATAVRRYDFTRDIIDLDSQFVLASDYDALQNELAKAREDATRLREILGEAREHFQHTPGDCRISLGEIKECTCGVDSFAVRVEAALTADNKERT